MRRSFQLPLWAQFAIPLAIAAAVVAGFAAGGPAIGFLVALVCAGIIVAAAIGVRAPAGRPSPLWLIPLALAVAGGVVVAATSGTAQVIGWGVVGVAAVIAMSLVFLEVGYSEERARARGEDGPGRPPQRPRAPARDR